MTYICKETSVLALVGNYTFMGSLISLTIIFPTRVYFLYYYYFFFWRTDFLYEYEFIPWLSPRFQWRITECRISHVGINFEQNTKEYKKAEKTRKLPTFEKKSSNHLNYLIIYGLCKQRMIIANISELKIGLQLICCYSFTLSEITTDSPN